MIIMVLLTFPLRAFSVYYAAENFQHLFLDDMAGAGVAHCPLVAIFFMHTAWHIATVHCG